MVEYEWRKIIYMQLLFVNENGKYIFLGFRNSTYIPQGFFNSKSNNNSLRVNHSDSSYKT